MDKELLDSAYLIRCNSCNNVEGWDCLPSKYSIRIKEPCGKCGGELYQDFSRHETVNFSLKGEGWTLPNQGVKGKGYYKKGSQEDLDDAERENDMLMEKPYKDDTWKRVNGSKDELAAKLESITSQHANGVFD